MSRLFFLLAVHINILLFDPGSIAQIKNKHMDFIFGYWWGLFLKSQSFIKHNKFTLRKQAFC